MSLVISIFFVIGTSILTLSFFKMKSKVSYLLAIFLVLSAEISISIIITSFFQVMTPLSVFLFQTVVLAGVFIGWIVYGRPELFSPFKDAELAGWFDEIRRNRALFLLVCLMVMILLAMGVLAWVRFDQFGDTRVYHYPRVALWMQNQTVFFTQETAANILDRRIIGAQPISNYLYLWMFLWTKSMRTLNFVEWAAALPLAVGIYGLALRLSRKRLPAMVAALVYLSYETVFWNMIHANAVLTSAAFLMAGLYFLKISDEDRHWQWILFSCLGLGLAFGAKATAYYLAPFIAVALIIVIIRGVKEAGWRYFFQFTLLGLITLLVFTGGFYAQNIRIYGGPVVAFVSGGGPRSNQSHGMLYCGATNALRFSYLALQPDPIPAFLEGPVLSLWASIGEKLRIHTMGCTWSDPLALDWYGNNFIFPIIFLLTIVTNWRKIRSEKDHWRLLLWGIFFSFYSMLLMRQSFHAPHFRYLAIPIAIFCALAVDAYEVIAEKKVLLTLVLIITGYAMVAFTIDEYRENYRDIDEFKKDVSGEGLDSYAIDSYALSGSTILGFFGGKYTTDIMLFGDSAERDLIFTTCENLHEALLSDDHDVFVHVYYEQGDSVERCRGAIGDQAVEEIKSVLDDEYILVYHGLHTVEPISIYLPNAEVTPEILYPTEFPPHDIRITVHENYESIIGAGPILLNTGAIGENKPIEFGLRSKEDRFGLPVTIEFFGGVCQSDDILQIKHFDGAENLISEGEITVRSIDGFSYDSSFFIDLVAGINRFSINDSDCDPPVDYPLYFNRIIITPDIASADVKLSGDGWYGLEFTPEGNPFRWVNNDAEVTVIDMEAGAYSLIFGIQSGPGHANEPFTLSILDEEGDVIGSADVSGEWGELSIPIQFDTSGDTTFLLHTDGGGQTGEYDLRILNFLIMSIRLEPVE